jgi:protein-disulfide isomerase
MLEQNNNSFFSKFSPKVCFILGFLSSLVIFFVVGFFVLLGTVLGGSVNDSSEVAGTGLSGTPTAEGTSDLSAPSQEITLTPITDADWVKGGRDAKVSVVEFSDLECPFCQRFHPTMQRLIEEYDGQVNWVYRHFPLTSLHPKAPKEAEAAECAGELGGNDGFWAYVDRLFEITPANNGLDASQLPEIAEFVGLSRSRFEECLNSGKYTQKVNEQYNQATSAGGRGTPYSVVVTQDGQKIPISGAVPFEQLKAVIDPLL